MSGRSSENRLLKTGGVWLALALTAVLAGAAAGGLWLYASSRTSPAALRAAAAPAPAAIELTAPAAVTEAPAPLPASPPETEAVSYEYDEIIAQEDGILVARISGRRYRGVVAVVDDPTRLFLGSIDYFSFNVPGRTLTWIAEKYGAVLGMNGGGFADPNGEGTGGIPDGLCIMDGQIMTGGAGYYYQVVALDDQGVLHAGTMSGQECLDAGVRWAVSFGPTLLIDGEIQPFPYITAEPRSALGQREDGALVLMVLEGRQAATIGSSFQTLAEAMQQYGAVNAGNLDGGFSSGMYYNGAEANICNSTYGTRIMPVAWLVLPTGGEEGSE